MARAAAQRRYNGLSTQDPFYARADTTLLAEADPNPTERRLDNADQVEWQTLYDHLEGRFQALWTWRVPRWTTWAQIARFIRPERFYWFVETANVYNQGLREDFAIVDRTASLCSDICAAGVMSLLTDPDRPWLKLGPAIPNLELDRDGKQYYEDVTERLNYVYDHSNFYDAQAQQYADLSDFGDGVVIDYESSKTILDCFVPCAGEYLLGRDFSSGDDVLNRDFRQTVSETVGMFGIENCPAEIQRMWREKGAALEHQNVIRHSIEPNFAVGETGAGVVPGGFAWREVYWLAGKKDYRPLSMTGFHEQPFGATRWGTRGMEPYGKANPGENALGDTIQLQLETRQKAESIEKVNRPPMGADVALQNLPPSTSPGQITYMNTGNGGGEKKFFPLFEVRPDIPAITADIKIIQDRISRTFYNDVFQVLMTLRTQMELKADLTATEVDQLTQEVLMRLGPMIYRAYGAMRQRVKRHLAIMARKGLLPPKPPSLARVPLKIEFDSLLTEAKRRVETQAVAKTAQFIGEIAPTYPEVKFKFKAMDAVEAFGEGVGLKPNLLRTDDEAKKEMQLAQQDLAMKQMAAQALPAAKAAEALSRATVQPGSALAALVGGGPG